MWVFFALAVLNSLSTGLGVAIKPCRQPTLLYDTLHCTPVFKTLFDGCPSKFDCSNIVKKSMSNDEKCYFDGKTYENKQSVNDVDVRANCQAHCLCSTGHGYSEFVCAIIDCPEMLHSVKIPAGCHEKYELGQCCSAGLVCNSTSTCKFNGKTIKLGKKVDHPYEKCTQCVCAKGSKVQCQKLKCFDEIRHQKEVYSFCAPSYIASRTPCCPVRWICPEPSDQIKKAVSPSENKCKFGNALLNIGDKFSRTKGKGKVTCECRIPPYLTCIQNYDYPVW